MRALVASIAAVLMLFAAAPGRAIAGDTRPDHQNPGPSAAPSKFRDVIFTYSTDIGPIDSKAKHLDVWIPIPHDDPQQAVGGKISIDSPLRSEIVELGQNGNRVIHLSADAPVPASLAVKVSFEAKRHEEVADLPRAARPETEPADGAFAQFLKPDRLVPIGGKIARISATLAANGDSPFARARAIYEYVTSVMKYDKTGTGWGRGDALYACDAKRGNCTDFHSLFIALARSRGIPARFTIGFPLGQAGAGQISGYHCWAEFYSGGVWVPVDASEAWKHPERHDYYFGHLDADRVAFTMGRDLELKPRQNGGPVNFLIYPYVEVDGVSLPASSVKNKFEYRPAAGSS